MRDSASELKPVRRTLIAVATLTLLFTGSIPHAARAAQPAERLTAGQRQELERQARELQQSGLMLNLRGEIAPAMEKMKQALQVRDRLYPKSEYPDGHPDLAASLSGMGVVLKAREPNLQRLVAIKARQRAGQISRPTAERGYGARDVGQRGAHADELRALRCETLDAPCWLCPAATTVAFEGAGSRI